MLSMKVKPLIQGFQSVFCKPLMVPEILLTESARTLFFMLTLRLVVFFFTVFKYAVTVQKQRWVKLTACIKAVAPSSTI